MRRRVLLLILLMLLTVLSASSRLLYRSRASSTPNLYIDPSSTTVNTGSYFSVNINITGVNQLALWQLTLYYENSILNGTLAMEGPFLRQGGSTFYYQVQFNDNYNQTHGIVELACTITGNTSGVNGTGTLATIEFRSIRSGNATLHLEDTKIGDSAIPPNPIDHTTTDGTVQATGNHDIAVANVNPLKTIVGQGCSMHINVTVENQGDQTETFNVTTYATTPVIQTQTVTLESGAFTTLTFTWNTTGFAKGNYTIWAYATPVSGETETADNTFTDGTVVVTIPGDIDGDFRVQLVDLVILAKAYGSKPDEPKWNPDADIDNSGVVGLADLVILAKNYGKSS